MQINDLAARINDNPQLRHAVARVIDSGWLVLGPEVRRFEGAFAAYLGAPHCVCVANGTDAIELALRAMGVGPGDRVATVANAGMYATTAMLQIGAEPLFMDVDLDTRNVGLSQARAAIEAGAKVIVATHLYGLAVPDIAQLARLCADAGVGLLEDCAQAHGARIDGQCVGTFGDAASFSFYPTKNLGALGDGGAVVTRREDIAKRVAGLRQYGWGEKYQVQLEGGRNSRLDELQAAILSSFLPRLDEANARRREIAARYGAGIVHPQVALPSWQGEAYVGHLYVLRSARRDALRAHLRSHEIGSDVHYPVPDHRQPVFGQCYSALSLPNVERLAYEVLTLPCYPEMSDADVARVVAAVNDWQPSV
ncbi:lipopolysaccharides biosynthesis aminotransferase [Bordetella ansorpii]|uniref:Lipopolysaccharides biosynthesis aminotransferase n=1 Tax=Bordetella ansorpii TaxID=288768 RepID=A0A157S9N6_9BORD|nr:DegT/DnrJ/EryC1/StrS family aminotransferase [Bordetella ansorpii]SAI67128.1 lipopolysaccharides biosynthesis aminotransferase [Bordetella ansorpii]